MGEADLGRILEEQGAPPCGRVDLRVLATGLDGTLCAIRRERARVPGPVVFDGLTDDHCALVAEAIWNAAGEEPAVVLSAQGFAHGLGLFRMQERVAATPLVERLAPVEKLLVVSGSAASVTASQIEAFGQSGAATLRLRASEVLEPARVEAAVDAVVIDASHAFEKGRSVCIFTALGPDDEDTPSVRETAERLGFEHAEVARRIGAALGDAVLRLVARHGLTRVAVAGGDSSSYALRRMTPHGLSVSSGDYVTSAHVLRLSGPPPVDGLEITLKGGQVGDEGFFMTLRDGRPGRST
jgi:uncharacterized protein YgbK (DUF1537 family)